MTNESIDNIKSLLYCALVFYDLTVVNKVLHNNGFFLGLSKGKFIFMLQKDRFISGGDFDQKIQSETFLAMDTDYIGHRCFRFQSPSLTNGKEQLWNVRILLCGSLRRRRRQDSDKLQA